MFAACNFIYLTCWRTHQTKLYAQKKCILCMFYRRSYTKTIIGWIYIFTRQIEVNNEYSPRFRLAVIIIVVNYLIHYNYLVAEKYTVGDTILEAGNKIVDMVRNCKDC